MNLSLYWQVVLCCGSNNLAAILFDLNYYCDMRIIEHKVVMVKPLRQRFGY